jgi:hypothetical protein
VSENLKRDLTRLKALRETLPARDQHPDQQAETERHTG